MKKKKTTGVEIVVFLVLISLFFWLLTLPSPV